MKETGTIIFNPSVLESDLEAFPDETTEWRDTSIVYLPQVTRHNWTQAQTAWHAIDEVPEMEPGKLVTNGLVIGHDEQVLKTNGFHPFRGQISGLRSISDSSDRMLRSFTEEEKNGVTPNQLITLQQQMQVATKKTNLYVLTPAPEVKKIA